jgi:hypothetical protein
MEWSDFGATSGLNFQNNCQDDWEQTRGNLEVRVLEDIYSQCESVYKQLNDDGLDCEELMATYLAPVLQ